VSAAAAAVLALGAVLLFGRLINRPEAQVVARLQATENAASVQRAGSQLTPDGKMDLLPADVVSTVAGGKASVLFADGTRLVMSAETTLRLNDPNVAAESRANGELLLQRGELKATIAPQDGQPFILCTPHAEVRVLGTAFSLAAKPQFSKIEMDEGHVSFASLADGKSAEVAGGEYAVATSTGELSVYKAVGVTQSFQDGVYPSAQYAGTRNASIHRSSPDVPLETSTELESDEGKHIALLKWSLTSIPRHSQVVSAQLSIFATQSTRGQHHDTYEVQRDWQEGEVTWTRCSLTEFAGPLVVPLNAAGVATVQKWVEDPLQNFGVLFATGQATKGLHFASRTAEPPENRPKLTVQYRPWSK
jgi:hypothetical protein